LKKKDKMTKYELNLGRVINNYYTWNTSSRQFQFSNMAALYVLHALVAVFIQLANTSSFPNIVITSLG